MAEIRGHHRDSTCNMGVITPLKEKNHGLHHTGADSLLDAAYRFAHHETGADVVLFGTGNLGHLEANIASLLKPALPSSDIDQLLAQFGHLMGLGLDQSRRDRPRVP